MMQVTPQSRLLMQLLLLQAYLNQQARVAPKAQQPDIVQRALNLIRQGRSAYQDGTSLYNTVSELMGANQAGNAAIQAGNYTLTGGSANSGLDAVEQYLSGSQNAGGLDSVGSWLQSNPTTSSMLNGGATSGSSGTSSLTSGAGANAGTGLNSAGLLAAGLSLYNDAKKFTGKDLTDEQKTLQAYNAVPRAVGAYFTGGLSLAAEGLLRKYLPGPAKWLDNFQTKYTPAIRLGNKLWASDEWKQERNRLKKLIDQGVAIPDALKLPLNLTRGRKQSELTNPYLPKDFVGMTPQYGWVNNKFAQSRNVADLKPEDIWGYSAFFEKFGNDWLGKFSEQQRRDIAQKALNANAVKEHHGTIDVNWTPELTNSVSSTPQMGKKPAVTAPPWQNPGLSPMPMPTISIPRNTLNQQNMDKIKRAMGVGKSAYDRGR
jgi:hypothetical protein